MTIYEEMRKKYRVFVLNDGKTRLRRIKSGLGS